MDTRIDVLFKVEGQHITSASDVIITSGSRNYFHAVFEFDAIWLNLSPKAVFTAGKKSYIIPLDNIDGKYRCVIPWEAIDKDTGFYVGAFGGDSLRSDLVFVAVSKGVQIDGEMSQPPTPDWYDNIERLTDKAVNTATEVQQKADSGEFNGKDGDNGKSAYELALENGYTGTEEEWLASLHGKDGIDGKNGADGRDGADGYTPAKGVDYFDGRNGTDGKDGANGKDGTDGYTPIKGKDYFDGKDGYTPVKGIDYYTEADKEEMVQAVIAALPTAEGGAY